MWKHETSGDTDLCSMLDFSMHPLVIKKKYCLNTISLFYVDLYIFHNCLVGIMEGFIHVCYKLIG